MEHHELIYVSLATREMSIVDLTALMDQARGNNFRLSITGLRVYHQREFMQLLEGSKEDIFLMYDTICKDDRNVHNNLMWDGPITQRSFVGSSMAFLAPKDLSLEGKPAYSRFLQTGLLQQILGSPATAGKSFLTSLRDDFLRETFP